MNHRWRAPCRRILAAAALTVVAAGCQALRPQPVASKPVFYPLPPDPPRVQYLTSINTSWDVVPERVGLARIVFGKRDELTRSDLIRRPYGVAVWNRRIYVCDQAARDVAVFDLQHLEFRFLSGRQGILAAPTNLCVDEQGYKFVVESMRGTIHVFGPDDRHAASFRVADARPGDVVVVGSELFVTDVTGDRILVLDRSTGRLLRTFGSKGKGPGEFIMPNAIAADGQGHLYVSDQMNFRFQKLDRQGRSLLSIGQAGDAYGTFARPRGIAVGPDGVVYVVESVFEVVQMFNQRGQVLMAFGNYHAAPGFLELPAGIAVDASCLPDFNKYVDPRFEADYLVFVASQVGQAKIGVYAFGRLKPGVEIPALPPVPERATTAEPQPATSRPAVAPG